MRLHVTRRAEGRACRRAPPPGRAVRGSLWYSPPGRAAGCRPGEEGARAVKLAWVFPGQGSQVVGMGKAVADAYPAARAVFAEADRALGEALSRLCFEGPLDALTLTRNTQPALVTTSMAILAALRARVPGLPAPVCAAGHSLGEYSALCAAGSLDLGDAVRLCRRRGEAMQGAVPEGLGAMGAVMGVDPAALAALCAEAAQGEIVSPANFNAPGQVVIAGHAGAVARAAELVRARGGKLIPLKVSAPFHCALMAPVRDAMRRALAETTVRAPAFPVIANVDAAPETSPAEVRDRLERQVDSAVEWQRTVEHMRAEGVTHVLEIGPGKVLAGLVRRTAKELETLSLSEPADLEKVSQFIGT
ncbi:MAG: ACP S-malonyltransferase [Myxococcales bacterium]|nr:ACP S-malonyltransferase [Myxococcales bacterium]